MSSNTIMEDVTQIRLSCFHCNWVLIEVDSVVIPFTAKVSFKCPGCGMLLENNEDFRIYRYNDDLR